MIRKITYSARRNADGTYRGIVWHFDKTNPVLIVGFDIDERFYTRKEAIAEAKKQYQTAARAVQK
jgi:hypothetical protein